MLARNAGSLLDVRRKKWTRRERAPAAARSETPRVLSCYFFLARARQEFRVVMFAWRRTLLMLLALASGARGACTSNEDAAYFRIAHHEWKEKPPSTPELPFRLSALFCRRFVRFWRSEKMASTRAQYGDLCVHVERPLPLFHPTILGICPCACPGDVG